MLAIIFPWIFVELWKNSMCESVLWVRCRNRPFVLDSLKLNVRLVHMEKWKMQEYPCCHSFAYALLLWAETFPGAENRKQRFLLPRAINQKRHRHTTFIISCLNKNHHYYPFADKIKAQWMQTWGNVVTGKTLTWAKYVFITSLFFSLGGKNIFYVLISFQASVYLLWPELTGKEFRL